MTSQHPALYDVGGKLRKINVKYHQLLLYKKITKTTKKTGMLMRHKEN